MKKVIKGLRQYSLCFLLSLLSHLDETIFHCNNFSFLIIIISKVIHIDLGRVSQTMDNFH